MNQVLVWILFFGIFAGMILMYGIFSRVYAGGFFELIKSRGTVEDSAEAQNTVSRIEGMWKYWPVVLLLGLLIWVIRSMGRSKSERYGGY